MARTYKRDSRGRFAGGGGGSKVSSGGGGGVAKAKKQVARTPPRPGVRKRLLSAAKKAARNPVVQAAAVTAASMAIDVAVNKSLQGSLKKVAATKLRNQGLRNTQKALGLAAMTAKRNRRGVYKVTTLSGKKFAR